MEFYLVKDSVKVEKIQDAIRRATKEEITPAMDEPCTGSLDNFILSLADSPVNLRSSSFEESGKSKDLREMLKRQSKQGFADVKLEVFILHGIDEHLQMFDENDEEKHLTGYFLLSAVGNGDCTNVNIIELLEHAFGGNDVHFDIELSLVHLSSPDGPVSLDSVVTLKASNLKYCTLPQRIGGHVSLPFCMKRYRQFEQMSGFIQAKLSVKVKVDEDGVNYFLKFGNSNNIATYLGCQNRKVLEDRDSADVNLRCKNGKVVKCHWAFLAAESMKLGNELKGFVEEFDEVDEDEEASALEMGMSEEGVRGFLEWIYCKQVTKAVEKSEVAVELLKAARQYEVRELETEMEKLIMSKGTKDLKYFTVEAALNLYMEAKDKYELIYLREKAVRVLKNYTKTAGNKLNESVEYQNFFRNDLQEAMKLSHLYGRL